MNEVIRTLKAHRSYRDFDPEHRLEPAALQQILDASRQAPSWMNGQAYSIVVMDDKALQKELVAQMGNNAQVADCSVFLLYLLDMRRMELAAAQHGSPYAVTGDIDALMTTTTDASLALENAAIAAESMGLGTVMVGTVRRIARFLIDRLALPAYVYPFCGLCIGKATVEMRTKPRLPERAVVGYHAYSDQSYPEALKEYDETLERFAEARETKRWSVKFADYHSHNSNEDTVPLLRQQKFL